MPTFKSLQIGPWQVHSHPHAVHSASLGRPRDPSRVIPYSYRTLASSECPNPVDSHEQSVSLRGLRSRAANLHTTGDAWIGSTLRTGDYKAPRPYELCGVASVGSFVKSMDF